jgi:hypothetical protein
MSLFLALEASSFVHEFLPFVRSQAFEAWSLLLSRGIVYFHRNYFVVSSIILARFPTSSSFRYLESGSPFSFLERHVEVLSVS